MNQVKMKRTAASRFKQLVWRARFEALPVMKRVTDIALSVIALTLLSPIVLVVCIAIKFDSSGPVLYQQQRIGLGGKPFTMWKFRSMSNDAEVLRSALDVENEMDNGVLFKIKRDPRVTRVGRFIRKASIDELPQLINVLKGDMSLVGPRPPLPAEVAQYKRLDRQRLAVLPGITCLWQVSGRSDVPFEQQVKLDIEYIERQSVWYDLQLLIRTIPAVLMARGAY